MFKHRARLLCFDAGEPVDEVLQRRVILQVLEQRSDGYSRTAKDPCPADACRVSFYNWTGGPINREKIVALGGFAA